MWALVWTQTPSCLTSLHLLQPTWATFVLDANNEADFLDAKVSLENGLFNAVVFGDGLGFTFVTVESVFFNPLPVGNNGVDFQGFSIGSIALTVDNLTLVSPGTNPNGNGIWTDILFRGTISVYAVPEPSSVVMFAAGGLVLRAFSARMRRR